MPYEIALVGFVQALFFSTIVLMKRSKKAKDYFLAFYLILLSLELAYRYLISIELPHSNHWLVLFDIVYWALFGPVLLLYTKSVIDKNFVLKRVHLLHLIPLSISLYAISGFVFTSVNSTTLNQYFAESKGLNFIMLLIWEFSSAIYLLFILRILIIHRKMTKQIYASLEKHQLNWLLFLVIGFTLYIYSSYAYWILKLLIDFQLSFRFIDLLALVLCVYIFVLGLFGYKQDGVFFQSDILLGKELLSKDVVSDSNNKYLKTRLSENDMNDIVQKIEMLMESDKPYTRNELSLTELAQLLDVSLHKLSQTINLYYKKNFFEFINEYRIKEFKNQIKLKENQDLKIEAIAYDCGFNSKSAFYSIFRRLENTTPSQYKNKLT